MVNLTSHEGDEIADSIFPLQIFYSQDRWLKENEDLGFISAGSIEICRAKMSLEVIRKGEILEVNVDGKLDSCGSVSLAHSSFLRDVAPCKNYGLRKVILSGIGGKSEPLRQAGLLHVRSTNGENRKVLCYVFDRPVGNTKEILLFSLRTIREARIDIIHHMDQSLKGVAAPLRFLEESSAFPKKEKVLGDKLRATKSFLREQSRKLRKAAITPMQLLEQIGALGKYNKGQRGEAIMLITANLMVMLKTTAKLKVIL